MSKISIKAESISSEDGYKLIEELSNKLKNITGSDGKTSFNNEDMLEEGSVFVVARDSEGRALGCGALRYYSEGIAEVKRMYVREGNKGTGSKILEFLENKAKNFGYKRIILETRVVNEAAVGFYVKNKYNKIDNYGKYIGREEAICFEKLL